MVEALDAARYTNRLTGTEHMVIIVTLEDGSKWLTDVGFGGQVPRRPLRIDQLDLNPQKDSKTFGKSQLKGRRCSALPRCVCFSSPC